MQTLHHCISIGSQKYISRQSYLKRKRQINETDSGAIEAKDLTDEEKNQITTELMENARNPYSMERTNQFFDVLFKEREVSFIKSKYIQNKEEALMFASALIYSQEDDFHYRVELEEGYESTVVADISKMTVRRKG